MSEYYLSHFEYIGQDGGNVRPKKSKNTFWQNMGN